MMGPMHRRTAARMLAFASCLALADAAVAQAPTGAPTSAASEYERLGRLLQELESAEDGPWTDATGASFEGFTERGAIDARMQRWLDRTRPLIGDLVRTASIPYDRPLDRSQGFSLLMPHLAQQRAIVKSLDVLLVDARRRDPAVFVDLLRAQAALGERTASDGVLISSLVAMACGEKTCSRLDEMIDRGELDRDLAAQALAATDSIAGKDALRLADAVESEHDMLALEINKVTAAEGDARAERIRELTSLMGAGANAEAFGDDALAAFPADAEAFRAATRAVLDAPTREAAMKATAELNEGIEAGTFGPLLATLAPAIDKAIERAWRYDAEWAAVQADLAALADGRKTPEDLMDAGLHYIRAAAAAQRLRVAEQAEFDSLRLAGDALEPGLRAVGKVRLARLQHEVTAEVFRGSQLGRLDLDDRTLARRGVPFGTGLVRATQPGINGAVRTMLAAAITDDAGATAPRDAPLNAHRDRPVAPPQELAVAAVRVAAHYASTGQFGHTLAALAMLRDAADALEALAARGRFDADGKAMLARAPARLDGADPTGLARATAAERTRLGRDFADTERLARLAPRDIAFLIAAVAPPDAPLAATDCDCPDHGALLDMRAWFDADALAKANLAHDALAKRRDRAADEGLRTIPGPPLEGLDVAAPFDLDRARESARTTIERLQRLAA